jgi:hypothetical protein
MSLNGPPLPTCHVAQSGSVSWGTSDVRLMLSAQPFVPEAAEGGEGFIRLVVECSF